MHGNSKQASLSFFFGVPEPNNCRGCDLLSLINKSNSEFELFRVQPYLCFSDLNLYPSDKSSTNKGMCNTHTHAGNTGIGATQMEKDPPLPLRPS